MPSFADANMAKFDISNIKQQVIKPLTILIFFNNKLKLA